MTRADRLAALELPAADTLDDDLTAYFDKCVEKLGFVPNVLQAYRWNPARLRNFIAFVDELMLGESGLSKLEREMIATVVSSENHCYYCQVAHGWAVRRRSGDPAFGEQIVMNYRAADLDSRQRAMLDFSVKLTEEPDRVTEADRQALRDTGFSEQDIWDIAEIAAFFNMSNRMASATEMVPNPEYHAMNR